MYCRNCGKQIDAGQKFCPYCGKPVSSGTTGSNPYAGQPYNAHIGNNNVTYHSSPSVPEKPRKKKTWLKVLLVIVIIFVLLVVIASLAPDTDTDSSSSSDSESSTSVSDDTGASDTSTESEDDFKKKCEPVTYEELTRNPSDYKGKYIKYACYIPNTHEDSAGTYVNSVIFNPITAIDDLSYSDSSTYKDYNASLQSACSDAISDSEFIFTYDDRSDKGYNLMKGDYVMVYAIGSDRAQIDGTDKYAFTARGHYFDLIQEASTLYDACGIIDPSSIRNATGVYQDSEGIARVILDTRSYDSSNNTFGTATVKYDDILDDNSWLTGNLTRANGDNRYLATFYNDGISITQQNSYLFMWFTPNYTGDEFELSVMNGNADRETLTLKTTDIDSFDISSEESDDDSDNSDTDDSDEEYIYPQSDSEYISAEDASQLDDDDLRIAINEIYARHGYHFKSSELQDYFDSCSWYTDEGITDQSEIKSDMNKYEKKNLKILVAEREERK